MYSRAILKRLKSVNVATRGSHVRFVEVARRTILTRGFLRIFTENDVMIKESSLIIWRDFSTIIERNRFGCIHTAVCLEKLIDNYGKSERRIYRSLNVQMQSKTWRRTQKIIVERLSKIMNELSKNSSSTFIRRYNSLFQM